MPIFEGAYLVFIALRAVSEEDCFNTDSKKWGLFTLLAYVEKQCLKILMGKIHFTAETEENFLKNWYIIYKIIPELLIHMIS